MEVQDPLRNASSVPDNGTCDSRHASGKHETGRKDTLPCNPGEGSGAARLPSQGPVRDDARESMAVFVLDKRGKPLMPCTEKRARLLLGRGRARVHRVVPFVIRLTDRLSEASVFQTLAVKIEPGSRTTGLALVRESGADAAVLNLFELIHRGRQISEALTARSNFRRRRRSENLRYRPARFHHLLRPEGWLAPSLRHRVETTFNWVRRLLRWAPVTRLVSELVRYTVLPAGREENLSDLSDEELLVTSPQQLRLARTRLHDAAAVNGTRWVLADCLLQTGLPVELAGGGRTNWNRTRFSIPQTQAHDAVCVGKVTAISGWRQPVLEVKCTGRGSYQRTRVTAQGFPRGYLTRSKRVRGFQTGDRVRAEVPTGKNTGLHTGRVAVRATGNFNIQTADRVIQGVSHRYCTVIQRADGYSYSTRPSTGPAQAR